MVNTFSTYGMAGIGIAAAIGFVFALTLLNSNSSPLLDTSQDNDGEELVQRQSETQPDAPSSFLIQQEESLTDQQRNEAQDDAALFAKEQQQSDSAADMRQQEGDVSLLQEQPADSRLTLSSLIAVNGTRGQTIREIAPSMEFEMSTPFFIRANFVNPSESEIVDLTIVLSVVRNDTEQTGNGSQSFERAANFRGDISANRNVELELYWNPDNEGEYVVQIMTFTESDLTSQNRTKSITSVPIRVTAGNG